MIEISKELLSAALDVEVTNVRDKYLNGLSSTKVKMLSSYEVEI